MYLVPGHLQRGLLPDVAVSLRPPTLNQVLVSAYLCDYEWCGQIETYGELYQERSEVMFAALADHTPEDLTLGGDPPWVRS